MVLGKWGQQGGGGVQNITSCLREIKVETAAKPLLDKKPWVLNEVSRIWCHLRDWSGYHIYFKINDLLRVDNVSHISLARPDRMQDSSLEKKQKQMEILATTHFNVEGAAKYYPALRSVFFCFMLCLVLFSYVYTWKLYLEIYMKIQANCGLHTKKEQTHSLWKTIFLLKGIQGHSIKWTIQNAHTHFQCGSQLFTQYQRLQTPSSRSTGWGLCHRRVMWLQLAASEPSHMAQGPKHIP